MSSLYQPRKFERARGCVERHRVGGVVEAALLKEARSLPHKESQYRSARLGVGTATSLPESRLQPHAVGSTVRRISLRDCMT